MGTCVRTRARGPVVVRRVVARRPLGAGWARTHAELAAGDTADEVGAALVARELLRYAYSAPAFAPLTVALPFYTYCSAGEVAELTQLADTLRTRETEIHAYRRCGLASNGLTEAVNLDIGAVRRTGRHSTASTTIATDSYSPRRMQLPADDGYPRGSTFQASGSAD